MSSSTRELLFMVPVLSFSFTIRHVVDTVSSDSNYSVMVDTSYSIYVGTDTLMGRGCWGNSIQGQENDGLLKLLDWGHFRQITISRKEESSP